MDNTSVTAEPSRELAPYSSLPLTTKGTLERCLATINAARATTIEVLFEIGRQLRIANNELAHHGDGLFGKWVKQECRMSRTAAYDTMKAFEVFGEHQHIVCPRGGQSFDIKALSYLSRDTTPEAAVKDALRPAEAGEHVTLGCAKKLVAKYTLDQAAGAGEHDQNSAPPKQGVADFEATMREEALRWLELCSPPNRCSIVETLRRIADELDARLRTGAVTTTESAMVTAKTATGTEQVAANDITIFSNP